VVTGHLAGTGAGHRLDAVDVRADDDRAVGPRDRRSDVLVDVGPPVDFGVGAVVDGVGYAVPERPEVHLRLRADHERAVGRDLGRVGRSVPGGRAEHRVGEAHVVQFQPGERDRRSGHGRVHEYRVGRRARLIGPRRPGAGRGLEHGGRGRRVHRLDGSRLPRLGRVGNPVRVRWYLSRPAGRKNASLPVAVDRVTGQARSVV